MLLCGQFRVSGYLKGEPFEIETDHAPLQWFMVKVIKSTIVTFESSFAGVCFLEYVYSWYTEFS